MIKIFKRLFSSFGFAGIELILLVTIVAGIAAATRLAGEVQNLQKQAATGSCTGTIPAGCKLDSGQLISGCGGASGNRDETSCATLSNYTCSNLPANSSGIKPATNCSWNTNTAPTPTDKPANQCKLDCQNNSGTVCPVSGSFQANSPDNTCKNGDYISFIDLACQMPDYGNTNTFVCCKQGCTSSAGGGSDTCPAGYSCKNYQGGSACTNGGGDLTYCKDKNNNPGNCCYPVSGGGGGNACTWNTNTKKCTGSPNSGCYIDTGGGVCLGPISTCDTTQHNSAADGSMCPQGQCIAATDPACGGGGGDPPPDGGGNIACTGGKPLCCSSNSSGGCDGFKPGSSCGENGTCRLFANQDMCKCIESDPPPPDPVVTNTPTPTLTPTITLTPTPTLSPTPTLTPTLTPTPTLDPTVPFWYDRNQIPCFSQNYRKYYDDPQCTDDNKIIGYQADNHSEKSPCNTIDSGECFSASGNKIDPKENNYYKLNIPSTCQSVDNTGVEIYETINNCYFGLPPSGNINVTLNLVFKNQKDKDWFNDKDKKYEVGDPFYQIGIYLSDITDENVYIINEQITKKEFPENEFSLNHPFKTLYADHRYEIYAKVLDPEGMPNNSRSINIQYDCGSEENSLSDACELTPDGQINITVTFPKSAADDDDFDNLSGQALNNVFLQKIDAWINGELNAIQMSEFLLKVKDAPGLKTATCDPTVPGGCIPVF